MSQYSLEIERFRVYTSWNCLMKHFKFYFGNKMTQNVLFYFLFPFFLFLSNFGIVTVHVQLQIHSCSKLKKDVSIFGFFYSQSRCIKFGIIFHYTISLTSYFLSVRSWAWNIPFSHLISHFLKLALYFPHSNPLLFKYLAFQQ